MFKKTDNRYITRGIEHTLSKKLVFLLWTLIDQMEVEEKDYLQVFDLERISKDDVIILQITHTQEVPEYENIIFVTDFPDDEMQDVKVFVIDDETHQTMLLAEEY